VERTELSQIVAEREHGLVELHAALALLRLAMDQIKSTVWATDRNLKIQIMANGELPSRHCGVVWEVGKNVYEIFKSKDPKNLAIAAHLFALSGSECESRLDGEFSNMFLRVKPLLGEQNEVLGCVSILNTVGA
jgi:hypothetical protein